MFLNICLYWPLVLYLILGLIFRFFSGDAYLLGIFKILTSDKKKNKELVINILLLFCEKESLFASVLRYNFYVCLYYFRLLGREILKIKNYLLN